MLINDNENRKTLNTIYLVYLIIEKMNCVRIEFQT